MHNIIPSDSSNSSIIDNRRVKFHDIFKEYCKDTSRLKIASGYFYASGFDIVKNSLKDIPKIQIVMGNETDLETVTQMDMGYSESENDICQ